MHNLTFVYVPSSDDKSQAFVKLRRGHIRDAESYNDSDYITVILKHISILFESITSIQRQGLRTKTEEEITDFIKRELQNDEDFCLTEGFRVNSEARNQSSIVGYYDLKFENSYWQNNYFVLECKRLNASDVQSREYIHKKTPSLEDGGMYRFFINKYAEDKAFGGMLGYIVKDDPKEVIVGLQKKIKTYSIIHNGLACGAIINQDLLNSRVSGFDNSFQSNHTRVNQTKTIHPIHLFHLFWDLTNCSISSH